MAEIIVRGVLEGLAHELGRRIVKRAIKWLKKRLRRDNIEIIIEVPDWVG